MQPRIDSTGEKKLLGMKSRMSFSNNQTTALWKSFMPRKKEILNPVDSCLYSLEVYTPDFFREFNPDTLFEKWAAIEVTDYNTIPEGMETMMLPSGLYAVFIHKGPASNAPKTYGYIFREWLPASEYELDNRPHFALMGDKYKHDDPDSEEEIWIPVRKKI